MEKIFNRKSQKNIRRQLRSQEIYSEKLLWNKLRKTQLGYKFRRQHGIGDYVVDFYCPQLKLVLELDGGTHCTEEEIIYDKNRQKYIESLGLIVKRYGNDDVKKNLGYVVSDIREFCEKIDINNDSN